MKEKQGFFQKVLRWIENTGNKLPDPVTLFVILAISVLIISWLASLAGVSAIRPGTNEPVAIINLLNTEGMRRIFTSMVRVFTEFPPLGIVLVVMLGIGIAEKTGLISAVLKAFVAAIPSKLVTFSLVFAGMMSSLAVDAGYVVLVPLGAVVFHGLGRHPLAGLAAAFAGVSGGFSANLVLTSLDPLLAGFTKSAVDLVPGMEQYPVYPTANYYLMIALVPVFALTGTFVSEKIVEPMLGEYKEKADDTASDDAPLTGNEKRGIVWAFVGFVITCIIFAFMVVPEEGILRGEEGSLEPFYHSIVPVMLFVFFIPGLIYGLVTKSIRNDRDVAKMSGETMSTMGSYIVLAFVAAQFVAYFNWSNLGIVLAIFGANFLQNIGLSGVPLIIMFFIIAAILNLFMGSSSAKWAIMAPIFVPMFIFMGYSPELAQAAYRLGDSSTNIITPLLFYFPLIIIFAQKYVKDVGIGTIISMMFPYSIALSIISILLIGIWMIFDIPLGPDAPVFLPDQWPMLQSLPSDTIPTLELENQE